jgi:hypothetical protein
VISEDKLELDGSVIDSREELNTTINQSNKDIVHAEQEASFTGNYNLLPQRHRE